MVLNEAQKAVLAKMPKEKQKEILKREKEKDKKKKKNENAEEHILKKIIKERDDYEKMVIEKNQKISDQKFFLDMYYYVNVLSFGFAGASLYNLYYDLKHYIKIPRE